MLTGMRKKKLLYFGNKIVSVFNALSLQLLGKKAALLVAACVKKKYNYDICASKTTLTMTKFIVDSINIYISN
jgi:hypothetical protein